jgi:hypothetical protein
LRQEKQSVPSVLNTLLSKSPFYKLFFDKKFTMLIPRTRVAQHHRASMSARRDHIVAISCPFPSHTRALTNATSLQNLIATIEVTSDLEAQATLGLRVAALSKVKIGLEEERDRIRRVQINWKEAEEAYLDFVAWCDEVRDELTNPDFTPTYQRKREAIERIGLKA